MAKCIDCGKPGANYIYVDEDENESFICENCVGHHFTCPECGKVYPDSTYDYNGYCQECDSNH